MFGRLFLALVLVGCSRSPEKITKSEVADAAPAPPSAAPAPAPLRPIPNGLYSSEDGARIQLDLGAAGATLVEHKETERAPLKATGKYTSKMDPDGSFVVEMTIAELEKKFLSRCLDCKGKDVHERFDAIAFDGEPLKKGAVVTFTVRFTESDRVAEMCFAASKRCTRLVRG